MEKLTKQEIKFCINVLDINAKDLRKEAETLSDYAAWQRACIAQAENYDRIIKKLTAALNEGHKRIAID